MLHDLYGFHQLKMAHLNYRIAKKNLLPIDTDWSEYRPSRYKKWVYGQDNTFLAQNNEVLNRIIFNWCLEAFRQLAYKEYFRYWPDRASFPAVDCLELPRPIKILRLGKKSLIFSLKSERNHPKIYRIYSSVLVFSTCNFLTTLFTG